MFSSPPWWEGVVGNSRVDLCEPWLPGITSEGGLELCPAQGAPGRANTAAATKSAKKVPNRRRLRSIRINGFMLSSNQGLDLIFLFAAPSHKHARVTPHSLDGPWPKMFQLLFFAHPSLACARWEKRLDPVGPHCQERPTRTRDPMALCCRGAARRYGEGPIRHGPESPRARRLHIRSTRLLRLPRLAWPGRAPLRSRCFDRSLPQPDRMGHLTHGCFV